MNKQIKFYAIKGFEGLYEISKCGVVKSLPKKRCSPVGNGVYTIKEKKLNGCINRQGYVQFSLRKNNKIKTFGLHQLLAITFLGHIVDGQNIVVDHIDNNKSNNNIENLQLISQRENASKDRKNKSSKYTGVTWFKRDGKWKAQITLMGKNKHLGHFVKEVDAYKEYQKALKIYNETKEM